MELELEFKRFYNKWFAKEKEEAKKNGKDYL